MSLKEKPKVVVSLPLEDDLKSQIEEVCEVAYVDFRAPRAELLAAIQNVVGVLGTPRITVDIEFLDTAPELKVFSTQSVGYDPVDVPEATRRGVLIGHTPGVAQQRGGEFDHDDDPRAGSKVVSTRAFRSQRGMVSQGDSSRSWDRRARQNPGSDWLWPNRTRGHSSYASAENANHLVRCF